MDMTPKDQATKENHGQERHNQNKICASESIQSREGKENPKNREKPTEQGIRD